MARKTPKPQDFTPADIEEEIALRAREVITNLVTTAALIDCPNDDKDYVPVTVLLCAMKLARLPLQDRSELLCFFDEIAAMIQAAERISEQPVDPYRLGLLGCSKTLCTVARTVADGGIGIGPNQVYGEVVFNLLLPHMPAEIESMRARVDEARRTKAAST